MIELLLLAGMLVGGPAISQPQVWLFSEVGTTDEVWRLPAGGGLEDALRDAGFAVFHRQTNRFEPGAADDAAVFIAAFYATRAADPTRYAIGFGLGGTIAAEAASKAGFQRVVLIGSPLAFGGGSRAAKVLFNQDHDITWEQVGGLGLQGPTTRRSLVELLLTRGLPSRIHAPFRATALRPIPASTLRHLRSLDEGPVPVPHAAFAALKANPTLEVLVVTAMGDGLFPPWQCDPAAFGLRRENIERAYFTQANDSAREYGHLDLLLHPAALGEVHPRILDWLAGPPSPTAQPVERSVQTIAPGADR